MAARGVVPIKPGCGGSEFVVHELAQCQSQAGHDVTLVSDVTEMYARPLIGLSVVGVDSRLQRLVVRLPSGFFTWVLQHLVGNLSTVGVVRRLARERRYDVLHVHGNLSAILLSFLTTVPLVYTEHDAPPWQCRYRRWWERLIRKAIYRALNVTAFRRADHVIATFTSLRDEIVSRWGVDPARVSVIPNGASEALAPTGRRRRLGANGSRLGANGSWRRANGSHAPAFIGSSRFEHYCLFVGRLTPRKGPDFVIRALAEAEDDVCCVFAGDGPMRNHVEQLAERLGVADRTAFLGNVDVESLPSLYANADLLILPSVSEASPLVVAEAMACGTPVLATRIAGLPTLVEDWETGFLVHPDNVGELAVALRFLMHDGKLRRRMSEKARSKVTREFLWPRVATRYDAVYRSADHSRREQERTHA
jgi:glycosyltransferase involved in cell wall biosynthesis